MKFKESELLAAIAAIEADLDKSYELAKSELVKADGDDEKEAPVDASDASPSESVEPSATPAADVPPAEPAADAAAPAQESAPADASAQPDPAAAGGAQPPLSMEALQAEYAQLPPEELEMHIQAALAAKEALSGAAGGAGQPAPDAGPMTPAPDQGQSAPPMAMKGELPQTHEKANGGITKSEVEQAIKLSKSEKEAEIKALNEKIEALEKHIQDKSEDVENLTKAIKMVLERPERKAVTGINFLGKSEAKTETLKSFSKSDADRVLKDLIPKMTKSERQTVLDYYNGVVKVDALAPILEKANLK